MALFSAAYGAEPAFNVRAVEGGDAAEMVSRLNNAIAAAVTANEEAVVDFLLAGAGSGPQWEAWLVMGTGEAAPVALPTSDAQFAAAVAGSPEEALFYLKQRIAAAVGDQLGVVYKVEVAGAGDGPTYMAVALFIVTAPD